MNWFIKFWFGKLRADFFFKKRKIVCQIPLFLSSDIWLVYHSKTQTLARQRLFPSSCNELGKTLKQIATKQVRIPPQDFEIFFGGKWWKVGTERSGTAEDEETEKI